MLSLLTVSKAVLRCSVTVNLERVPLMTWRGGPAAQSLSPDDDVCSVGALAAGIVNLSTSMNAVLMGLDAVERKFSGPGHHTEAVTAIVPGGMSHVSVLSKLSSAVTRSDKLSTLNTTGSTGSWASRVASTAAAHESKVAAKPVSHVFRGMRSAGSVKAIQRPLACFVGRLDVATTEVKLHDYLDNVDIHNAVCKKLSAKDGRVFKTAAFRFTCCTDYREAFCNEDNWPTGAELRDWVFYNNNGSL
jgi:hypothetical protein